MPLPSNTGAIPIISGLLLNSNFLYGNLGACTCGLLPYITKYSASRPHEIAQAVDWFIDRDKVCVTLSCVSRLANPASSVEMGQTFHGSSGILSVLLYGFSAYYASDPLVSRLLVVATAAGFVGIPYTQIFIRPLNSAFKRMAKEAPGSLEGQKQEVEVLYRRWRLQANVRILFGAASWVAAVLALEAL